MTTTIAVCALTFRRPVGLAALLESLARLDHPGDGYALQVIIVDNDPEQSARELVEHHRTTIPWELRYVPEPRRGIPFGRNAAVRTAGAADFVAFLDDDEIAEPRWLTELLRVQRATGADVVTGTVLPMYEQAPPAWVVDGGFFERPRFADGAAIPYARTSNVLIAHRVFPPGDDAPFNEAMGLNGGDDTHFFIRAALQGFSIVWADHAVVHDLVPVSRMDARWLLKHEYRRGNTISLCLRDLRDSPWRRVRRVGNGLYRMAKGFVVTLIGLPRGRAGVVSGLKHIAYGAGLLTGLVGFRYDEYAVVHGS